MRDEACCLALAGDVGLHPIPKSGIKPVEEG